MFYFFLVCPHLSFPSLFFSLRLLLKNVISFHISSFNVFGIIMSPCFDRLFTACMSRLVMFVYIALIKKKNVPKTQTVC